MRGVMERRHSKRLSTSPMSSPLGTSRLGALRLRSGEATNPLVPLSPLRLRPRPTGSPSTSPSSTPTTGAEPDPMQLPPAAAASSSSSSSSSARRGQEVKAARAGTARTYRNSPLASAGLPPGLGIPARPTRSTADAEPKAPQPAQPPATTPLSTLTPQQVAKVITSLDFAQYALAFANAGVCGADLASIEDSDLVELGITLGLHRKRLLRSIDAFVALGVPSSMVTP